MDNIDSIEEEERSMHGPWTKEYKESFGVAPLLELL
jgi:hypothetical protein